MSRVFRVSRRVYELFTYLISKLFSSFAAVRVVAVKNNSILAVDQGSYYELPGGAVEYGETLEEAVLRETREETGVEVEVEHIIGNSSFGSAVEFMFAVKPKERETSGSWEGRPVWLDLEEAKSSNWRYERDIHQILKNS